MSQIERRQSSEGLDPKDNPLSIRLERMTLGPAMQALSPKRRLFVLALGDPNTKEISEAGELAGYGFKNRNSLRALSSEVAHDPKVQAACHEMFRAIASVNAPRMLLTLTKIADSSDDDKVRIQAASKVLDLSGMGAGSRHTVEVNHTHELKGAALDTRIAELLAKANGRSLPPPIDITPNPAPHVQDVDAEPIDEVVSFNPSELRAAEPYDSEAELRAAGLI